jgi:hypothetical protein
MARLYLLLDRGGPAIGVRVRIRIRVRIRVRVGVRIWQDFISFWTGGDELLG